MEPLVVWYNTRCPVCDAGIGWQRSRLVSAVRSGAIEFRDINQLPGALATYGADLEAVRRRLHAVDGTSRLFVGIDCAIEIWRRTPGDAWLAGAVGLPVVRPVARLAYDGFAAVLYSWNRWRQHW